MSSANKIIFQRSLKELRLILCQKSDNSQGVREFVEKYYIPLKIANPNFPILIRECSGVQPMLYARYEFGREVSAPLSNEKAESILERIVEFSSR